MPSFARYIPLRAECLPLTQDLLFHEGALVIDNLLVIGSETPSIERRAQPVGGESGLRGEGISC